MKFGFRTPNLKKSFKARTTGRLKRQVKRAVIPGYGKKGMGYVKNPKKAVYNKIYNKTTIDPLKPLKIKPKKIPSSSKKREPAPVNEVRENIENYEFTTKYLEEQGYRAEDYVIEKGSKKVRGLSIFCGLATMGYIMPENRNLLLAVIFAALTYITWQKSKTTIRIKATQIDKNHEPRVVSSHGHRALDTGEAVSMSEVNPKFSRTEKEDRESSRFYENYLSTIRELEDPILPLTDELIENRISSIKAFNELEKFCYSKGRGGKLYFDDMWLHCHNSKNPCFSFKDRIKDALKKLYEKYDELPDVYRDDYYYFRALRVVDLKQILKDHDLPVSGKKEELINRLIENKITPVMNAKIQKELEEDKDIILQNKAFIKENRPWIIYYLREPNIPEEIFQKSFNDLKNTWGFTPSYSDVLWDALGLLKLQSMQSGDASLYEKITRDQIEILEMEGKFEEVNELRKKLDNVKSEGFKSNTTQVPVI